MGGKTVSNSLFKQPQRLKQSIKIQKVAIIFFTVFVFPLQSSAWTEYLSIIYLHFTVFQRVFQQKTRVLTNNLHL